MSIEPCVLLSIEPYVLLPKQEVSKSLTRTALLRGACAPSQPPHPNIMKWLDENFSRFTNGRAERSSTVLRNFAFELNVIRMLVPPRVEKPWTRAKGQE